MKSVYIAPPSAYYWFIILSYMVSLLFLTPEKSVAFPAVVWIIMAGICALIISSKLTGGRCLRINSLKHVTIYNSIISLGFLQSACFSLACLLYRFHDSIGLSYSLIFFIFSLFALCLMVYFYVDFLSGSQHVSRISVFILKVSWVFVSIWIYSLSRSIFMHSVDIPYEQTVTKVSVLGYALLLISFVYVYLGVLSVMLLFLLQKVKRLKSGRKKVYSSFVVFIPSFFFWITMSSIYQVNLLNAMKVVFNVTMPMDARDTFFCHDTYMRSRLLKKAIYIKVSDSDYRVALPYNFEYQFLRLRCLESSPYYAIIPVEDADNLKYSQIRRGFYNLITDLDSLYLKSSDKRMR